MASAPSDAKIVNQIKSIRICLQLNRPALLATTLARHFYEWRQW